MTTTRNGGYWVVTVDRRTGKATTSKLFRDEDAAYDYALDTEDYPTVYTTVVRKYVQKEVKR